MLPSRETTVEQISNTYPTYKTYGSCESSSFQPQLPYPAWRRASKAPMAESKPAFSESPPRRQRRRWSHSSKPGKSNGEIVSSGTLKNPYKKSSEIGSQFEHEQIEKRGVQDGFFSNGRGRFLKDLTYLPPINPREKRFLLTVLSKYAWWTNPPTIVTKMPCAPLGKVNWNTPCVASWKALLKSCNSESWQPMAGRNPKTHKHRKLVLLQISCVF